MASYTPHRPDLAPPERLHVGGQEREIEIAPGVPMRFCWCPPGEFLMGSPKSEADRHDDEIQHPVRLTQGFWLAKHHVTQRQWQAVMGCNPTRDGKDLDCPVVSLSWEDCRGFCEERGLYLPAEAQWEYACRAGTHSVIAVGGGTYLNAQIANFDGSEPYGEGANVYPWINRRTKLPVASFPPNAWGLHDMHGQVTEWCYDSKADYANSSVTDPLEARQGEDRVLRGGSWFLRGGDARSALRTCFRADRRYYYGGFRPSSIRPVAEAKGLAQRGTTKA